MRRPVILSCCILLMGAAMAQAENMYGTGQIADGDFTFTRTPVTLGSGLGGTASTTNLDRLDIYYTTCPSAAPGASLRWIEGTWAASAGGYLNVFTFTSDTQLWRMNTANTYATGNIAHGVSYVNMDGTVGIVGGTTAWGVGDSGGSSGTWYYEKKDRFGHSYVPPQYSDDAYYYTSLTGGWSTELYKLVAGGTPNLLAQLWVTPGSDVTFTGASWGGWKFGDNILSGSISTVPEPTTLALLGMGLIGLLCYAWRKYR